MREPGTPKLGPEPTLLSRKEVDALYETLAIIQQALRDINVEFIVTGGSLLGAIRQHSILFCDDDVDIAIIEDPPSRAHQEGAYEKVRRCLPAILPNEYQYQVEPWPGGDRVRPRKMNNVFVDIFSLRRYDSEEELIETIGQKQNGSAQSVSYVNGILQTIQTAAFSQGETSPLYPCWQFATRKAIEMWPKEVYRDSELFPLSSVNMGSVAKLSGPRVPVLLLKRAFGLDCFEVFYQSISHTTNGKGVNKDSGRSENGHRELSPLVGGGGTWETQAKVPLEEQHYLPMQPTSKAKRRFTGHNKTALFAYLETQTVWEKNQLAMLPVDNGAVKANGMNTTKTIYMDGVFDLFHIGHLNAIQQCAKLGNRVIIGVTGDQDAVCYKRKPVMTQKERTSIVAAIKVVNKVICPCPLVVTEAFMNEHKIDLVVHGFANEDDAKKQSEFFGIAIKLGKFQQIPYTSGISTTERIKQMTDEPSKPTKPQWFGSCISLTTNKSSSIPFKPFPLSLRIAIEPHIQKALERRKDSLHAIRISTGPEKFDQVISKFLSLGVQEGTFCYNVDRHDLRKELLQCLENGDDKIDLSRLHESPVSKDRLLQSLVVSHLSFQHVYDEFVRHVCIPKMASLCDDDETIFYYQAFPCIRVVQPGEFSIGPHSDVNYGHHPCSINCYVLLTDISEENSASILFLESGEISPLFIEFNAL
jgi:choline-phosphate cytidylyltransferase